MTNNQTVSQNGDTPDTDETENPHNLLIVKLLRFNPETTFRSGWQL
jgi:hypothetical protein